MPLNQRLNFKAPLRKIGRIQIPKIMQEQFQLETTQTLNVTISHANSLGVNERFMGKMRKDGCITIPPAALFLLKGEMPNLENHLLDITMEPL